MKNDWLNGLKNRMEDFEESVPEGLWETIDTSVFAEKKPRRKVILPWIWRTAASAAVVAVGLFAGLRLTDHISQNDQDFAHTNPSSVNSSEVLVASADMAAEPAPEEVLRDETHVADVSSRAASVRKKKLVAVAAELSKETDQAVLPAADGDVAAAGNGAVPSGETVLAGKESDEKTVENEVYPANHDGEDWSGRMSATSEKRRRSVFIPSTADLSLTGAATDSREVSTFDPRTFYRGAAPASMTGAGEGASPGAVVPIEGTMRARLRSDVLTTDVRNDRPIRAGLTVHWPIAGRLGIETGATMTMLNSTISTISGMTVNEDKQTLHYLGVPLNLSVNILDANWITIYALGGGMVEKCISAKVKSRTLANGDQTGTAVTNRFDVKPLLWSLNGAAGLQVNAAGNFGIYFEPGISYHFDDGSEVTSIYKERPCDFMMTFGIRYSFR